MRNKEKSKKIYTVGTIITKADENPFRHDAAAECRQSSEQSQRSTQKKKKILAVLVPWSTAPCKRWIRVDFQGFIKLFIKKRREIYFNQTTPSCQLFISGVLSAKYKIVLPDNVIKKEI